MLSTIAFWVLVTFIAFWILLGPVTRLMRVLWEIIIQIYNKETINLRTKFGEWAVVTGSTDGIGKAYAKELAARNMNLILISRNLEKLERTKDEMLLINPKIEVKIIAADFAEGENAFTKIQPLLQDISVGILVNNVGKQYEYPMYVGEVPEKELWDIINVNVGATTLMTRLVIGQMQKRKQGAIVNVSSGSEFQPLPLMTVYAATKAYVKSFSEALRVEYSRFGITIQHLSPLFVNTKMNAFSSRLQVSSIFVPDATTYARNAIVTLGKMDSSTGYWAHSIQKFFTLIAPVWIRTKIGKTINESFRQEYFKQKELATLE
ncbi:PREDICTED: inactive hydroxysteroid dehydrogenase-like protein 1 [Vollenhovia emeryi]|uniref:inactive hydroxysteroid dehydrogenase-like protein 1 n=1 Tax=Vollenhovia emeryi TaxID=411798 RepID=UPI0005F4CFCB|nr:PREDICTED: inactive hydroxysteroid dehydrogenase-like protein 1 [Vollenhovia emeryi]XP_011862348.1 PREDICTED: inactive hydroxysteroid dehydrogenase-like protein 1 [Vollenhovia emeryi]